ncbi:MAG TPA: M48 family metallopeptidase [Terriglobales bacterium]
MAKLSRHFIALVVIVEFAAAAWAVTPSTPQLPDPGNAGMSRQDQEKLGLKTMAEVYKEMPVLPDSSPVTKYVQSLGDKLKQQIPPDVSWPYQFHVIEQKEVNAFALPGGPIFINIGTINAAQNEAQLAGVMAHEMSHVYMQHSAKQANSPKRTITEVIGALGGVLGGSAVGDLAAMGIKLGAGTLLLKYSRGDEAQADSVGAIIMYKAGYNPMELAHFFDNLAKEGNGGPQFLSDHPNPGNRSDAISKEIQNWPSKQYNAGSGSFAEVKKQASSVSAFSAQEIADGAKQGRWASQNLKTGSVPADMRQSVEAGANSPPLQNVSFEQVQPSQSFTEIHAKGLSISYPANWSTAVGQNSITIAPKAGVSQNAIAYGAIAGIIQDQNATSVDQVVADVVQNLQQSNSGMRQSGEPGTLTVNGARAASVDLTGNSPLGQNGNPLPEHDWLVVVPAQNGSYASLIFISPEKDFSTLKPTYQKMLQSLRTE